VQPERETMRAARLEVAPRLPRVEGAALDEHIGGLRARRGVREHVRQQEVEALVGVLELRWHRVRPEEGRDAAGCADRPQRRQLCLAVEPVAGLALEGRRAGAEHPAAMALDGAAQTVLTCLTRRANRGEDAAARSVELLVPGTGRAQGELLDPVSDERRMGVAVDESRDRAEPAAVFRSAFRIGQSAIASEPSRIDSVSRYGDATEPESRWSRPITTGADTAPVRTSSLIARPALARSP